MMFSASPIASASESESIPFKASFSGPFQIVASTLTTITVAVTGEGRATHLGDSDLSATVTIVLCHRRGHLYGHDNYSKRGRAQGQSVPYNRDVRDCSVSSGNYHT